MVKPIVTDELWEMIEPLSPEEPPKLKGGPGPATMIAENMLFPRSWARRSPRPPKNPTDSVDGFRTSP